VEYPPNRLAELQSKFDKSPAEMTDEECLEFINLSRQNQASCSRMASSKKGSSPKEKGPTTDELMATLLKMAQQKGVAKT
jgi:hypothetical protein